LYAEKQAIAVENKRRQDLDKSINFKSTQGAMNDLLYACGYSVYGDRISISPKRFFSMNAAGFRFSLLRDEEKKRIGSPEVLLEISKSAWKRHKQLNALRQKNTFADCFSELLESKCQEKKKPTIPNVHI